MKRVSYLLATLAFSSVAVEVYGQELGDRQKGLALAQQVCSECHAIRGGQPLSPNSRSPTFTELATAPGMTRAALMVALTTPHAGMPMFMLTDEERAGIITYILSLK